VLFFMWGFLTCLNDILIPHLKSIFSLITARPSWSSSPFSLPTSSSLLPSGKLVEWRGYKQTMVIGLIIMAIGALLFLPAAATASFPLFLTALVVLAAGITGLQVSANPSSPTWAPGHPASRLNLAQAFNSSAPSSSLLRRSSHPRRPPGHTRAASKSFSASMLQTYREQQASSVRLPYLGITITLIALAVAIPSPNFPRPTSPATSAPASCRPAPAAASGPIPISSWELSPSSSTSAPRSPSAASSSTTSASPNRRTQPENRRQSGPPLLGRSHGRPFHRSGVLRLVSAGQGTRRRSVYRLLPRPDHDG